jgi:hypothetical protein
MSQQETALRLLQAVFVALPAVAIYLQILSSSREKEFADGTRENIADRYQDFHLARKSIVSLTGAGVLLVVYIMSTVEPQFCQTIQYGDSALLCGSIESVLTLIFYSQFALLVIAFVLFVLSVLRWKVPES